MIYLDTNVIINAIIDNPFKSVSEKILFESLYQENLYVSHLLIQETVYVLAKNKTDINDVNDVINTLSKIIPKYDISEVYEKGLRLATNVGFLNINDCLHTSFAEKFCSELITFDKDFKKITPHTSLKITIL